MRFTCIAPRRQQKTNCKQTANQSNSRMRIRNGPLNRWPLICIALGINSTSGGHRLRTMRSRRRNTQIKSTSTLRVCNSSQSVFSTLIYTLLLVLPPSPPASVSKSNSIFIHFMCVLLFLTLNTHSRT